MSTHDVTWFRSSYSGSSGDNCVEVAVRPGAVLVRDSKDTQLHPLVVSSEAWSTFTAHAGKSRV